jgi:hypothetical protein
MQVGIGIQTFIRLQQADLLHVVLAVVYSVLTAAVFCCSFDQSLCLIVSLQCGVLFAGNIVRLHCFCILVIVFC